jgi:hypothetical protein
MAAEQFSGQQLQPLFEVKLKYVEGKPAVIHRRWLARV